MPWALGVMPQRHTTFHHLWLALRYEFRQAYWKVEDYVYDHLDFGNLLFACSVLALVVLGFWGLIKYLHYRRRKAEERQKAKEELRKHVEQDAQRLQETAKRLLLQEETSLQNLAVRYDLDDTDDMSNRYLPPALVEYYYEKGVEHHKAGQNARALECLLCVLYGVGHGSSNTQCLQLVDCLHRVAELYKDMGHMEEAIRFIQAEKFVYENALLHFSTQTQSNTSSDQATSSVDLGPVRKALECTISSAVERGAKGQGSLQIKRDMMTTRLQTFSKLSQVYEKEGNLVMAMNYAIKAFNMRKRLTPKGQSVLGSHEYQVYSLFLQFALYGCCYSRFSGRRCEVL